MDQNTLQLKSYLTGIGLSHETIDKTLIHFSPATYRKNEHFHSFGDRIKLGFVCTGCFCMYSLTDKDEMHVKNFLGPQEFLLPGFNDYECGEVFIQALTDSTIMIADYTSIKELGEGNQEFQNASRIGLEKNFHRICNQLQHIKTLPAGESYEIFKRDFAPIIEHIPQYLIASYLGITPTQLSRIRRKTN